MMRRKLFTITGTSPASASTAVLGSTVGGLQVYDWFDVTAIVTGATGGTLDLYLQRQIDTNVWVDWVHFTQASAGAAATRYNVQAASPTTLTTVGGGSDAAPGVALAAGTFAGGHPGLAVRAVAVAGASTSAGAVQAIYIAAYQSNG